MEHFDYMKIRSWDRLMGAGKLLKTSLRIRSGSKSERTFNAILKN